MDDPPIAANDGRTMKRREGFPGQRHIVIPQPILRAALEHPLLAGLVPAAAGYFPRALGHEVVRAAGLREAILVFCAAGRGWAQLGGIERTVVPGDLLLIPPNQPHAYGAGEGDPWSISWVHLLGGEVQRFLELLALSIETPIVRVGAELPGIPFHPVCDALDAGYGPSDLLVASARLRAALVELHRAQLQEGTPETRRRLEGTITWMRAHLSEPVTLGELAEMAGLSVARYSALFRRRTGYPPIEYLLRQRVLRACELLDTTPLSVKRVALELGYDDQYYFSRVFSRIMGRSPSDYRRGTPTRGRPRSSSFR